MQSYNNFNPMLRACALMCVLIACLSSAPASAFVYLVDSTADAVDADVTDGVCATATNACTLRAAIQQANAWPGHDFIILPAGTFTLALEGRGDAEAATGDLDITGDVTIRGAGAGLTIIDAAGIDRVFDIVGEDTRVEISGLTIQGGLAQAQGSPGDNGVGGGIRNAGRLILRDVVVADNESRPSSPGFAGGGIHHTTRGDAVTLLLERVTVSGNVTSGDIFNSGGGIAIVNGTARIVRSAIVGNSAESTLPPPQGGADGGGIQIGDGDVVITETSISGNSANRRGGGISSFSAGPGSSLVIERSTLSGNTAFVGGGIYDDGAPSRTLSIVNSTISGNVAQAPAGSGFDGSSGGGLFASKPANLLNVTITGNTAEAGGGIYIDPVGTGGAGGTQGSATIGNTLIANQAAGGNCGGAIGNIATSGPNATGAGDNCNIGGIPGDPQLGALSTGMGGPTAVHVPQGGSPAENAGDNAICPATDQRGFPRPVGNCDIGAVEITGGTQADLALTVLDHPDPVAVGGTLRYVLGLANQGPASASGTQLTLTLPAGIGFAAGTGCAAAGNVVTCGIGALAAGAAVEQVIEATPTTVGTLVATAAANANENDPNPANNTGIEVVTDTYVPTDLVINTSAATTGIVVPAGGGPETTGAIAQGDTVIAGQPLTYTLTIDNTGGVARNVRIYNTLPQGISPLSGAVVSPAQAGRGCALAGQLVTCTLGDIPEGADVATVTIPAMPAERGTAVNLAQGNFDGTFTDGAPEDGFSIEIDTRADLALAMIASSNPVTVGANLGYVITATNNGPSNATTPQVAVTLPASVTYGSASAPGWTCEPEGNVVTCTRGSLNAGTSSIVTLFVVPNAAGSITASATVSGADTDPVAGNNSASAVTTVVNGVVNQPRLSVNLTAAPDPGLVGDNLSFVSTVSNTGNQIAGSVTLTQALPSGVTFMSATSGCALEGAFVQCELGIIIPGTNASATVVVRPEAPGNITSSVLALDAAGNEDDLSDNEASITVAVNAVTGTGLRSGGRCFIATAAYGSYLDPHVVHLRRFRDEYLMTHPAGAAFVALYYEVSPPVAAFIAEREALRSVARWVITPVALGAAHPLATAVLALMLLAALHRVTRRRDRDDRWG